MNQYQGLIDRAGVRRIIVGGAELGHVLALTHKSPTGLNLGVTRSGPSRFVAALRHKTIKREPLMMKLDDLVRAGDAIDVIASVFDVTLEDVIDALTGPCCDEEQARDLKAYHADV